MATEKGGWLNFLKRPSSKISVAALLLAGITLGLVIKTTFDVSLEVTSSNEFCTSCHEMNDNAWVEMQDTIHVSNSTGTIATCADCHVPHSTVGKVVRKIEGLRELYATITGKIDTPEKYEAHRQAMAEKVWNDMKANDSANCRACHTNFEQNLDQQYEWARRNHTRMIDEGQTCIDCHKGIAHELPNTRMEKPLAREKPLVSERPE